MLTIQPITREDYEQVRQLDALSFGRKSWRAVDNIATLCANHPDGCFLALAQGIPIGYVLTHTFGSVGYLGPLGINPAFQNQGNGKEMIRQAIYHLSQTCTVIGLETFPTVGKNIGLYHRIGFRTTWPVRIVTRSKVVFTTQLSSPLYLGSDLSPTHLTSILNEIRSWTDLIYPRMDFSKDVTYFLSNYPDRIVFYLDGETILGFLAFEKNFNPFVWGMVQPVKHDEDILKKLIRGVENLNWTTPLSYHYHTHHTRLTDIFLECGYHIQQDVTCMVFKDYEGCYAQPMSSLLIRSWWG